MVLQQLHSLVAAYQAHRPAYERITRQQTWFLGLADLLDVPLTETHDWPTQTGAEVTQALSDYLDALDALGAEMNDELNDEQSERSERKPWRRPTITTHGDFRKLTQTLPASRLPG